MKDSIKYKNELTKYLIWFHTIYLKIIKKNKKCFEKEASEMDLEILDQWCLKLNTMTMNLTSDQIAKIDQEVLMNLRL